MSERDGNIIEVSLAAGPNVDLDFLRRAAEATLRAHGARGARLSLALVTDARIAQIHRDFLDQGGATDVISFDLRDEPGGPIDGELIVSIETAEREAARRGHDATSEAALYVIHGTLHLLGFDDQDEASTARMRHEEAARLAEMGIAWRNGD